MDWRGRLSAVSVVVLASTAVQGCTASREERSAVSPPSESASAQSANDDLASPLPLVGNAWFRQSPFALSQDIDERLFIANQKLMAECLRKRGFTYTPIPFPPAMRLQDRTSPLDKVAAQTYGYHSPEIELDDPNKASYDEPSFELAYDVCGTEANSQTFRITDNIAELSGRASNDLRKLFLTFDTSEVGRPVAASWSACMQKDGYTFRSPVEAAREFGDTPSITKEELSVRMTDLNCDAAVGYTVTRHAWESAAVESWLETNEGVVASLIDEARGIERALVDVEAKLSGR